MLYPIAIELGDDTHAYGVTVPDIAGCFSAGDTMEEALNNVREASVARMEYGTNISQSNNLLP